ncbi:MAG: hypothetical protein KKA60_10920 [Proteobacteria bacterium]|nr:hypothetical protein [Pseudomonadota bacterium]
MGKPSPQGRILRVKEGYNPNSSSVGSHIPLFLAFVTGLGLLSVIAANALVALDARIRGKGVHARDSEKD